MTNYFVNSFLNAIKDLYKIAYKLDESEDVHERAQIFIHKILAIYHVMFKILLQHY
jgi:hypothetical protein